MNASDSVPRELVAGIVWTSEQEEAYEALVKEMIDYGCEPVDAERRARDVVSAQLCRRFVRDEVRRAMRCKTGEDKRRLMAQWTKKFGALRAKSLASCAREPKLRETILERW